MGNHRVTTNGLRGQSTRAAASNCGNYIGRVGALAVALGIGAAVITTPGIAWADDETTSTVDNDTVNETPNNPSTDTPGEHQALESHVGNQDPDQGTGTGAANGAGTSSGTGSGTSIGIEGGPAVTLNVQTVTTNTATPPTVDATTASPTPPMTRPATSQPTVGLVIVAPTPDSTQIAPKDSGAPGTREVPLTGLALTVSPVVKAAGGVPSSQDARRGPVVTPTPQMFTAVKTVDVLSISNPPRANLSETSTAATPTTPPAPQPTLFETMIAIPGTIISGVVNIVTSTLAPIIGPGGPMDSPVLYGALLLIGRELNQTFGYRTPALAVVSTSQDLRTPTTLARQALASPSAVTVAPGTEADLIALPGFEGLGDIRQSGYDITYGDRIQDSGFDDPTGSSTGHLDITVTRPMADTYPGTVYVYTRIVDGLNDPPGATDYSIGTFQRIDPGQTITVRESYVAQYAYPDGYSNPRQTVVDERTYALYARFSQPIEDNLSPTAPMITTTGNTDTTVDLRAYGGGDNVGITAYRIYRDGQLVTTIDDVDSGTYTDTGLTPETTYLYTARAVDFSGNESPSSAPPLSVTTDSPDLSSPTAPSIVAGEITDTTVSLRVFGGTDDVAITAYRIYRDGQLVATVNATESGTYTDTGLTPNTHYIYQASATDLAGNEGPLSGAGLLVTTNAYSSSPTGTNYDPNNINEQAWERALDLLGAIPVVGIFVNAGALGGDLEQLRFAIANHNKADIRDEIGDILADAAGLAIPFGGRILGPALTPIADVIAGQLIDFLI